MDKQQKLIIRTLTKRQSISQEAPKILNLNGLSVLFDLEPRENVKRSSSSSGSNEKEKGFEYRHKYNSLSKRAKNPSKRARSPRTNLEELKNNLKYE